MQYSETRKPSDMRQNPDNTQNNLFQKRPTPKETPIKVSSQLVMNQKLMDNNTKPPFNDSYRYNNTDNNNNFNNYNKNYYREGPLSQSFNVEAERQNRLQQQRQRDYEKPDYTEPNTDYYYKYTRTSSDVNDYNNRYTYNYRRDFDYIDFNKLSRSERLDGNNNVKDDNNDLNLKYRKLRGNRFEKPFEGPTPASRQRSFEPKFRKKGSDMEPFYKYKNVEYYGQRDPFVFGYDEVDDRYRFYSPFRSDYDGSRYRSYTYNYYLNAPMRGDISEDFKYPPQYYYRPKYSDIKPTKVFTNLF